MLNDETPAARRPSTEPPGVPRWLKIGAAVVGILILLFVLLHVTGVISGHGPGQPLSQSAGHWLPGSVGAAIPRHQG
jgi:hypothetical protein